MAFKVEKDLNARSFLNQAGELLYKDEAVNSLMLGICTSLKENQSSDQKAGFYRVVENQSTVLAAIQTPPFNLIVSFGSQEHLTALAQYLFDAENELPGVVGPGDESTFFSDVWTSYTGQKSILGMNQKIYALEEVIIPTTDGHFFEATMDHKDLVGSWLYEFGMESLPEKEKPSFEASIQASLKSIEEGNAFLWMVDGTPVSVAHLSRPTKNGISIRAVYTPERFRRRGFASGVVAHISKLALEKGKSFCVLYTDSDNSTSNKIYRNVGYKEIVTSKHFIFETLRLDGFKKN